MRSASALALVASSSLLFLCVACGGTTPTGVDDSGGDRDAVQGGQASRPNASSPDAREARLECRGDVHIAGEPTSILMKSDTSPQEIGDLRAAERPDDPDVTAHVTHQGDREATVVLEREDGTVNTILTIHRTPGYGWALERVESCTRA